MYQKENFSRPLLTFLVVFTCTQEQESRTTLLRKRSKNFTKDEIASCPSTSHIGVIVSGKDCLRADYSNTSISLNHGGHINFFHDIEDGVSIDYSIWVIYQTLSILFGDKIHCILFEPDLLFFLHLYFI